MLKPAVMSPDSFVTHLPDRSMTTIESETDAAAPAGPAADSTSFLPCWAALTHGIRRPRCHSQWRTLPADSDLRQVSVGDVIVKHACGKLEQKLPVSGKVMRFLDVLPGKCLDRFS